MDALFVMDLLKSFLNAFYEDDSYNNHHNIKDYIYRSIHGSVFVAKQEIFS